MYISVYNLFYTSLPVLALGIFEQDVSDKHSIEYPKLYTPGLNNALFNTTEFIRSVLHGVFSSLVLFLIPYGELYSKNKRKIIIFNEPFLHNIYRYIQRWNVAGRIHS